MNAVCLSWALEVDVFIVGAMEAAFELGLIRSWLLTKFSFFHEFSSTVLAVTGSAGEDLRPAEAALLFSNAQERSSAVFAHAGRSTTVSAAVEITVATGSDAETGAGA